jgi:hypothetical protein
MPLGAVSTSVPMVRAAGTAGAAEAHAAHAAHGVLHFGD